MHIPNQLCKIKGTAMACRFYGGYSTIVSKYLQESGAMPRLRIYFLTPYLIARSSAGLLSLRLSLPKTDADLLTKNLQQINPQEYTCVLFK
jgi:hypothetical protein